MGNLREGDGRLKKRLCDIGSINIFILNEITLTVDLTLSFDYSDSWISFLSSSDIIECCLTIGLLKNTSISISFPVWKVLSILILTNCLSGSKLH